MNDDLLDALGVNKAPDGISMTILRDEPVAFLSVYMRRNDDGWEWWPSVVLDGESIEDVIRERVIEHHRVYR